MDDRRFDSLVKAVASGASRRSVLKGMLGLGGAALTGGALVGRDAGAARRPELTPKPVSCPGRQTWNGSQCVCPGDAPAKCGPDCCTEGLIPPGSPGNCLTATHARQSCAIAVFVRCVGNSAVSLQMAQWECRGRMTPGLA